MHKFVSPTVLEIERSIHTLSFDEKLWLMERIAQHLRSKTHTFEPLIRESQLADLANDPEMQAELSKTAELEPPNLFGFLPKRADPLTFQQEMRDEWSR